MRGREFGLGNREPVNGIGAISSRSVVEAGFKNYGLNRNGFFVTDGIGSNTSTLLLSHGYLESRVDWVNRERSLWLAQ